MDKRVGFVHKNWQLHIQAGGLFKSTGLWKRYLDDRSEKTAQTQLNKT